MVRFFASLAVAIVAVAQAASAAEVKIGKTVEKEGLSIAAVYLQGVLVDPDLCTAKGKDADIHIEADIKAKKGNKYGFGPNEWVPYLEVHYTVTKDGSDFKATGKLLPMVANDGPHYGDNIKMAGPGKYRVTYRIVAGEHGFMRHIDKETGVGKWWEPISVAWEFTYVGSTGKKGGY